MSAVTKQAASGATNWARTFSYDAYGNMWEGWSTNQGVPFTGDTPTTNNYTAANRRPDRSYDNAGNETGVSGDTILYDAENRQAMLTEAGMTETYLYDGNGKRVAKIAPSGAQTVYVYDAAGLLTAEYATSSGTASCTTCYLSWDHLGTPRQVMDQTGKVVARDAYLPFGEEVTPATPGRNSDWGSGNDNIAQKFTGKERDVESGLDYSGARYYGSALGRFTSPDEPLIDQHTQDPQSWNLYAYVQNSPLSHVDLTGEDCITTSNQTSSGVEVITELGGSAETCSGTYVGGTVNTNSYQYNGTNLTYSFANDTSSGVGNIQFGQSGSDDSLPPGVASMLNRAGNMAAPGVNLAGAGLMAFGSIVAPIPMALAECGAGNCDNTNLAMAVIPDLGPILQGANLTRAARGLAAAGIYERLEASHKPRRILKLLQERRKPSER